MSASTSSSSKKDNATKRGGGGRPGVGKDGAAGVVVQAIVPRELVDQLDEWAKKQGLKRGPALRAIAEGFFGCVACGPSGCGCG